MDDRQIKKKSYYFISRHETLWLHEQPTHKSFVHVTQELLLYISGNTYYVLKFISAMFSQ